jgi:hypothetical protein
LKMAFAGSESFTNWVVSYCNKSRRASNLA